ncbi:hypothetical protein Vwe01_08770 [Micromonospora andamanensis]|nr:hypothetical protein Vwe01_08770 [Micromonospora andamanensis]
MGGESTSKLMRDDVGTSDRRRVVGAVPSGEPGRAQAFVGGFRGVNQNPIDKCKALAGISAGQGLTSVGVAGFEPTTSSSRRNFKGSGTSVDTGCEL